MALLKTSDGRLYTTIANDGIWTNDPSFKATLIQHIDLTSSEESLRARWKANELTITYTTPTATQTKIGLYDLLGRQIDIIADEVISAGETTITKQLPSLASGTYFVVATTSHGRSLSKVVK